MHAPATSCSRSIPGWPSGPGFIRRRACASRRSSRWQTTGGSTEAAVLDVGCGSGILAIAALRLGAASALGVDTDPIAVEATLANARRNRLARRIRARAGSLPTGDGPFDVVLANLIAGVLVPLAPALRDELRSGGTLVASGIFIDRESEVEGAFASAGLRIVDRWVEGEWIALVARRP